MTNREAISRVRKIWREVHADSRFTYKLAYGLLLSGSKLLIKQDSERLKIITQSNLFLKLKCIEVIEAPLVDPCCGLRLSCKIWRTKEKLPKLYSDTYGPIIRNVYTLDGMTPLTMIRATAYEKIMKNPWKKNKKEKYFFFSEDYLYFPNGAFEKVEVDGYWEDDISGLNKCEDDDTDCTLFLDSTFKIPGYLETPLFEMVKRTIAESYARLPEKSHQIDKNSNAATNQF